MTTRFKTASAAYAEQFSKASQTMEKIEAALLARGDCRTKNWAHVGSLEHVNELLDQIAEFLKIETNDPYAPSQAALADAEEESQAVHAFRNSQ